MYMEVRPLRLVACVCSEKDIDLTAQKRSSRLGVACLIESTDGETTTSEMQTTCISDAIVAIALTYHFQICAPQRA